MPICPRCGKSLTSEQALCYHLNKKFKCASWKCQKCSQVFDTKFMLNIHQLKCEDVKLNLDNIPFIALEYSNDFKIIKINSQAESSFNLDVSKLLGTEINQDDEHCSHVTKNGSIRNFQKVIIPNSNYVIEFPQF